MSYLEKELGNKEKLVYMGRISWWFLFPRILLTVIVLSIAIPLFFIKGWIGGSYLVISSIVAAFLLTPALVAKITTELAITDQRIMSKTGWLNTDVKSTPLNKVNNIRVKQSILGNLLNYGDIEITTATAEPEDNHYFRALAQADTFRNILSEELDKQTEGRAE